MNLLPTEEQSAIAESARAVFEREFPVRRYQDEAALAAPLSTTRWQMLADLGWFGLTVTEQGGGVGLGVAEDILMAREAGRTLMSPSALATALAASVAERMGDPALARQLAAGAVRCAFGFEADGIFLLDADQADWLLLVGSAAVALVARPADENLERVSCMDEAVSLHRCAAVESGRAASAEMRQRVGAVLCAYLSGIASAALEDAVAYASEREQFGQPIGSFQAINHMCADMAVSAEAAWAQTLYAGLAIADGAPGAEIELAAASHMARKAAFASARGNIQIHGAAGFTTEFDAHFYLKRCHVIETLLTSACNSVETLVRTGEDDEPR